MTVDKDKRRLIDIVDSIEAKLNKIIGDNNMGNLKYARDSVSEIPTFFSKRDKIKVAGNEKISERLELQIDIVNLLTSPYDDFCNLRDEIMLLIDIYTAKRQLETAEYFQSYMTSNSPFMKEIGYPYIKEIKNLIKDKTECLVGEL